MRMLDTAVQFEFLFMLMPHQKKGKNPQDCLNLQAIYKFHCYFEEIQIKPRILVLDFQRHLKFTLKYK